MSNPWLLTECEFHLPRIDGECLEARGGLLVAGVVGGRCRAHIYAKLKKQRIVMMCPTSYPWFLTEFDFFIFFNLSSKDPRKVP
jgi:hypothetical protein